MKLSVQKYFLLAAILWSFFSCSKDDGIIGLEEPVYNYYVSDSKINTLQLASLQLMYNQATLLYPDAGDLKESLKYNVEVNKMVYTTKLGDESIQASALVCLPEKSGSYPIICFQNGTNVLYSHAPTEDPGDQLFLLLESLASMGYIVIVPDYPGFGSSAGITHPYLIKNLTVQSLKDALFALVELGGKPVNSAKPSDELYLLGYSQGGWATLQLQKEIETKGLGNFELKASSCGAGPYNISTVNQLILSETTYAQPYFLAYIVNSYNEYGVFGTDISIGDIFNEPYATYTPDLFDGNTSPAVINDSLSTNMEDLFNTEYISGFSTSLKYELVRQAFEENSVEPWAITTPTLLVHGTEDETIPFDVSSEMYQSLLLEGTDTETLELLPIPDKGHTESIIPFGFATIKWFISLSL